MPITKSGLYIFYSVSLLSNVKYSEQTIGDHVGKD